MSEQQETSAPGLSEQGERGETEARDGQVRLCRPHCRDLCAAVLPVTEPLTVT